MLTSLFGLFSLALAALGPVPAQDAAAQAGAAKDVRAQDTELTEVDAALLALVDGGRDFAVARARAKELGRELLVVVTSDRAEGDDPALSLQERLVYGVVLADPRVRARVEEHFHVVSVPVDFEAQRVVAAQAFVEDRVVHVPSETKPVRALSPPALAILKPDGRVARALERIAPVDAGSVAAWLAAAPLRVEVPEGDTAGAAYLAATVRPVEEQLPLLAALVAGEAESRWALKARARRLHPELFTNFELLRTPICELPELDVLREARVRLVEAQRADGSIAATEALGAPQATALVALALHLGGEHDAAQRAVTWLSAAGLQDGAARDPLLLALWLDVQLARYDVGWSRSEDVEAAIAQLSAAALSTGGWAADHADPGSFATGCCTSEAAGAGAPRACSVQTGFALDALLRAGVPGFPIEASIVERATEALLALRTPAGVYSDLALPRAADGEALVSSAGMRGLAFAADAALARQGRLKRKDVVAAIDAYYGELADQRAREGFGGVGRRHPAETGETRALGWLAYTRVAAAAPGRALLRRDGQFRRVVAAGAGRDSTWLDTCEQGWVMATALASIALDVTR
jgi:hypothetical protein